MFQGRPGDKGQKGELGSPGFDVFAAVKVHTRVSIIKFTFKNNIHKRRSHNTYIVIAFWQYMLYTESYLGT